MTQRNKLVDLIIESVNGCARHLAEVIADHLIERGVIAPPCKVGESVYLNIYGCVSGGTVCEIKTDRTSDESALIIEVVDVYGQIEQFGIADFGKTVFLTREEATKAFQKEKGAKP